MSKAIRRGCLMALTMVPIASVAFAAKSALSVAQIGKAGVCDTLLNWGSADSR